MKVTLLGHASVFIEMHGTRCLMDPVFQDPFEDTAVVSCPRRTINLDAIPPIDLLVISHSHLDHFDVPSLAHIARKSRKCDVLCPKDQAIVYALEKLGFRNVHPEDSKKHFTFGKYELLTTHSHVNNVVEFGVVFKDRSGTFWNQVDTVIAGETVPLTLAQAGPIDLLFAMYASQNFQFFDSRGTGFPHEKHAMNLSNVMAIKPRMAVPGSAGFRFAGAGMEWCNAFLFPMARERFIADLARLAPQIPTRIANPGDIFEIEDGVVVHKPAASSIAKMIEDDSHRLRFDPTATIPPLEDPNPTGVPRERLVKGVEDALEGFVQFVQGAYAAADAAVEEYKALGGTYAIGVVFPDGAEEWLRVGLEAAEPTFVRAVGVVAPADAGHRIVASALIAWLTHEKSYFYLRAFSRRWSTLYALRAEGEDAVVEPKHTRDLLAYYLEQKTKAGGEPGVKRWLDFELKKYVRPRD